MATYTAPNGSDTILGLTGIGASDTPGEPFINMLLQMHSFQTSNVLYSIADYTTEKLYLSQSVPDGEFFFGIVPHATVSVYSGAYFIDFVGTGIIRLTGKFKDVSVVSGSVDTTGTDGFKVVIDGSNGKLSITPDGDSEWGFRLYETDVSDPITRIRMYRSSHEAELIAGKIWSPEWLAAVAEMNFGCLRSLAWCSINSSRLEPSEWSYRKPAEMLTYWAGRAIQSLYCGTTSGTNAYAVSAYSDMPTEWTQGENFQFTVGIQNTSGTLTIDVGGRGAKTVQRFNTNNFGVGALTVGELISCQYDSDLDVVLATEQGFSVGVPGDVFIDLCNQLNANCWFNVNHLVSDDYWYNMAVLARDTLASDATCFFEFSNEVWNFGAAFMQTGYCKALGEADGIGTGSNRDRDYGYGKKLLEKYPQVAAAYAETGATNYARVMGVHGKGSISTMETYRFEGADLPGPPSSPNRPIDVCEVICPAYYIHGVESKENWVTFTSGDVTNLLARADAYADGGNAAKQAAIQWMYEDVLDTAQVSNTSMSGYFATMDDWSASAATYGKLQIAYEGALSLYYPSETECTNNNISTTYSVRIQNLVEAFKTSRWACKAWASAISYYYAAGGEGFAQYSFFGSGSPWILGSIDPENPEVEYGHKNSWAEFNQPATVKANPFKVV